MERFIVSNATGVEAENFFRCGHAAAPGDSGLEVGEPVQHRGAHLKQFAWRP